MDAVLLEVQYCREVQFNLTVIHKIKKSMSVILFAARNSILCSLRKGPIGLQICPP